MGTLTWNQHVVKKNNKALVLSLIIEKETISRADIANVTGLNKTTVSSLVTELLEDELIYESGPGISSGGRRPVILHFNRNTGYAIGVDIGVNYVLAVLTDLKGKIIVEKSQNVNRTSYSAIISTVQTMIQSLIDEMPKSRYGIVGIGVGVPGIVNKEGSVLLAPNLGWTNIQLKEDLERIFNVPIIIENEANAGAVGEQQFGAGQDYQNILYVSAGIGIGVGIILNKELYQGKSGFSGEMGHMIIELNGKRCNCGSRGCWEAYASENALLEMAEENIDSLESLIQQAKNGEKSAIELFEKIGQYLGFGINNIINTFNPDQVIIGNRLASIREWIEEPILTTIENHTLAYHQKEMQLHFSKLGKYSTALGVSAFVVDHFIKAGEA
ncbi:ROK family transcriptional regulator [Mesobacillus selenatarsenatis]|uniref:Xylose-responsive transcription regulator, ROK family n=1 Tax=Mesobacillus selenatarsenatis (strain DSM 18680 / JCM 14380 / FERM P-15431 / SF-1) TaxID=1321606 RepID=A0A0A8XDN8_MESS1|nr:ROK family transcriptional regulator [Mesobacillus selenatarsenatis]GAM16271.1 xylose-responsive transcription regulator, ROK family [Mesobacillus selenatarsenatis SF-1]